MLRGNAGTHPVLECVVINGKSHDRFPNNCINCGAPLGLLDSFVCPNRLLTPKELGKFRGQHTKESKQRASDASDDLDDLLKGVFK